MKVGDKLFVYGTLRPNCGANYMFRDGKGEHVRQTRITGRLYSLGSFPGLKLENGTLDFVSEGPTVTGDVYELRDEGLIQSLDRYEGYPHLYDRRRVTTEDGDEVWVYTINGHIPEDKLIGSGDWINYDNQG